MEDFSLRSFNSEETDNGGGIWKYKYKIKNKYIIIFLICIFSLISLNIKSFGAITQDSDGVYQINTKDDLKEFRDIVNGTHNSIAQNLSANAILTQDIEFNTSDVDKAALEAWKAYGEEYSNWIKNGKTGEGPTEPTNTPSETWDPMGKDTNQYTGNFDGNGKTISGLFCKRSASDNCVTGLFGELGSGGIIKNVGVEYSVFYGYNSSYVCVGSICGLNREGTIINCYSWNVVIIGKSDSADYLGGICGQQCGQQYAKGAIRNCCSADNKLYGFSLDLDMDPTKCLGGIVGNCEGSVLVKNCYVSNNEIYKQEGGDTGQIDFDSVLLLGNKEPAEDGIFIVGNQNSFLNEEIIYNCYYFDKANSNWVLVEAGIKTINTDEDILVQINKSGYTKEEVLDNLNKNCSVLANIATVTSSETQETNNKIKTIEVKNSNDDLIIKSKMTGGTTTIDGEETTKLNSVDILENKWQDPQEYIDDEKICSEYLFLENTNEGVGQDGGRFDFLIFKKGQKVLKIPVKIKINYDPSSKLEEWVKNHMKHEFFRKTDDDSSWSVMTENKDYTCDVSSDSDSITRGIDGSKTQDFIFTYYIYSALDSSNNKYSFGFNKNYPVNAYINQDVGSRSTYNIDYNIIHK